MSVKVITSSQAAAMIKDGKKLCSQDVGGNDVAEEQFECLDKHL